MRNNDMFAVCIVYYDNSKISYWHYRNRMRSSTLRLLRLWRKWICFRQWFNNPTRKLQNC